MRITLAASMLIVGLTFAFTGMAVYYLVAGGPDRLRREFNGELPAQRLAAGEQLPLPVIAVAVIGLSVGLGVGIGLWKSAARRAGLAHNEIGSTLG
ncbi:MAG TPA: hypothetical protein VEL76_18705 [Gemmataceae bacterium]|nr:hypothetical protein [Gemmataceae bacterium]